jgi:hypothetical protein
VDSFNSEKDIASTSPIKNPSSLPHHLTQDREIAGYSSSRASVILQLKLRLTETRMALRSVTIVRSLAMPGQTAARLLVPCGVLAATCTKTARKKKTLVPLRAAAIANWLMAKSHTPPTIEVAASKGKRSDAENRRGNRKIQQDGFSLSKYATPDLSFAATLHTNKEQQQPQPRQVAASGPTTGAQQKASPPQKAKQAAPTPLLANAHQRKEGPPVTRTSVRPNGYYDQGQSVQVPSDSMQPMDDMLKVISVVQQIMTELSAAVSEDEKIVAITKIVLKLMKENCN